MDHLHRHCTCLDDAHDWRHRASDSEEPPEDEYRRLPLRGNTAPDRSRRILSSKTQLRPRR